MDDLAPSPLVPIGMGLSFFRWCKSESGLLNEIRYDAGFILQKSSSRLARWRRLLDRYFSGERIDLNEPIFWMIGTPFDASGRQCRNFHTARSAAIHGDGTLGGRGIKRRLSEIEQVGVIGNRIKTKEI